MFFFNFSKLLCIKQIDFENVSQPEPNKQLFGNINLIYLNSTSFQQVNRSKIDNRETKYSHFSRQGNEHSLVIFTRIYAKTDIELMLCELKEEGGKKTEVIRKFTVPAINDSLFPVIHMWMYRPSELFFSYSNFKNEFKTKKFNLKNQVLDKSECIELQDANIYGITFLSEFVCLKENKKPAAGSNKRPQLLNFINMQ